MKEFDHIEKMLKQGKLSPEQAELLKASLKESKQRKAKLNPRKLDDEESSPTSKIWIVLGGLFLILLAALVLSVGNKPLFFLLLLVMLSFGCTAAVLLLFFNILVWKKESVVRTRALIANEVERKKSLVPQIRESVSAYAGHEAGTYEKVIRERSAPAVGATEGDLKMDQSSFPFQALAERYPDIKSDQAYMQLFNQYVETENRITAMVRWYNHKVRSYNGTIEAFPFSIVAEAFSFKKATYLESA